MSVSEPSGSSTGPVRDETDESHYSKGLDMKLVRSALM